MSGNAAADSAAKPGMLSRAFSRTETEYGEVSFDRVHNGELDAISARRAALRLDEREGRVDGAASARAWNMCLLGLAFSGGGIRSATFNLGILQKLAALGLLRYVDYLSTVSGGGYIGVWLTALAQRTFVAPVVGSRAAPPRHERLELSDLGYAEFERRLAWTAGDGPADAARMSDPADGEHGAVRYLREFSNYLTPKLGVFSGDTWALIATYLRNALLNQLILVCALIAIVLAAPRLLASLLGWAGDASPSNLGGIVFCAITFAIAFAFVTRNLGWNLAGIAAQSAKPPNPHDSAGVSWRILLPLLAVGVSLPNWLPLLSTEIGRRAGGDLLTTQTAAALIGAGVSACTWAVARWVAHRSPWQAAAERFGWPIVGWSLLSGTVFGVGMYWAGLMIGAIDYQPMQIVIAPPLFALGILTAGVLHVGFLGVHLDQPYTEWLSRLGGILLISGIGWLLAMALILLSPLLIFVFAEYQRTASLVGFGWIATTVGTVLLGRGDVGTGGGRLAKRLLFAVGPWVFIVGLIVIVSAGANAALYAAKSHGAEPAAQGICESPPRLAATPVQARADFGACLSEWLAAAGEADDEAAETVQPVTAGMVLSAYFRWLAAIDDVRYLAGAFALFGALAWFLSRRIDVNSFSLHNMYANRLVRCYLGASVIDRWGNPFSGFSSLDDLNLSAVPDTSCAHVLSHPAVGCASEPSGDAGAAAYPGPYPLINTAVNLVAGANLAWQERKAAAFVLAPLYCGFHRVGLRGDPEGVGACDAFRPTREYAADPKPLTLGEAMATSGAAASPNMGYHSKPALAFLMGVFNIRLGRWAGNPYTRRERAVPNWRRFLRGGMGLTDNWKLSRPGMALWHLLRELFGLTDSENRFVYLSDGGHFENLGIYELVRRQCRYVVACDAGADPHYKFEDLANAIRKCRVDFGVEIDIDVSEIAERDVRKDSGAACAVGRIRYSEGRVGTLLYIKASRCAGLPSDVMQYALEHEDFPHQSTADQFFSESQFESYRRLGHFIAGTVLEPVCGEAARGRFSGLGGYRDFIDSLFRGLGQQWHPASPHVETNFVRLSAAVDAIFERLRTSPQNLGFLNAQFYPEWRSLMTGDTSASVPAARTAWDLPSRDAELREGFYFCSSLIQLMENVYLDLNLESQWQHPDNTGWMNLFHHWTWSSMFRVTWAIAAATYGRRFRAFCRRRLGLELGRVGIATMVEPQGRRGFDDVLDQSGLNLLERHHLRTLVEQRASAEPMHVYALTLQVEVPLVDDDADPADRILRSFVVGYALVEGDELTMFRVQDHLRSMQLGRRALEALYRVREAAGLGLRITAGNDTLRDRLARLGEYPQAGQIAEFKNLLRDIVDKRRSADAGR